MASPEGRRCRPVPWRAAPTEAESATWDFVSNTDAVIRTSALTKVYPGTDFRAVDDGYISVTPLSLDLTHLRMLDESKLWWSEP